MTTTPNMGIDKPTLGGDAGTWDDKINAALDDIDAHSHVTGEGVRVPTAGLNINADLTFASLYAPINLHRLTFASIVALTSNNKSLFVSSSDNELYWRSNTGTNVKLTSGSALNVAAFTGGIGGDYTAVSALVDYDDATDTYRFRQETAAAVRQFAKVRFADIQLVEYDAAGDASVPANAVTIKSPDALAANYSVTMPAALPGSTSIVQMDSGGVLTASNTLPGTLGGTPNFTGAVTMASTLGVTGALTASTSLSTPTIGNTPNFTGAVTMASTLGVTGLITATAGVTAAANQHVTVSGTGLFKHGTKTLSLHGVAFVGTLAAGYNTASTLGIVVNSVVGTKAYAAVQLPVGARILSIRVFIKDNSTGPTKLQASIFSLSSTGTNSSASSSVSAGNSTNQTLTVSPVSTITSLTTFMIQVAITTGTDDCNVYGAEVDYDQP